MVGEGSVVAKVAETEFADVDHLGIRKLCRIRTKVPRLKLVTAHLDTREVAHARDFGLVLRHAASSPKFFDLLFAAVGFMGNRGFSSNGGFLHIDQIERGVIFGLRSSPYVFGRYRDVGWVAVLLTALLQRAARELAGKIVPGLGRLACCC